MSCRAPGLSQTESEIELTDSSNSESQTASALQEEEATELDYEETYQQLERMKQRVLQMKSMIIRTLPTERDAEPSGTERVPADSKNVHLKNIQLETSRACQQLDVVRSRLKESTAELSSVNERIQESVRCTNQLAKNLKEVPKWMEQHKQQVGQCLERHHHLDVTLSSDPDFREHMRPLFKKLQTTFHSKVPMKCYQFEYQEMRNLLGRTRELLHQTREQLVDYTRTLDKSMATAVSLPSLADLADLLEPEQEMHFRPLVHHCRRLSWTARLPILLRKPLVTARSSPDLTEHLS